MTKDSAPHTSQDHDRKFQHDHITQNPRAAKDIPGPEDDAKSGYTEDKRKNIRHEDTNHFTNRGTQEKRDE